MFTVSFRIRGAYLATIIKELKLVGVGELFGEIDVSSTLCSTESLPKAHSFKKKRKRGACSICPSALDRMSTLEIHTGIVENSHINFDHVTCILLASGIAAVGLLTDSDALILVSQPKLYKHNTRTTEQFPLPLLTLLLSLSGLLLHFSTHVHDPHIYLGCGDK
jgi:hypothetical protein